MVIKCPKCNHYVSDTASVCPKCGASMTVSTPKNLTNDVTDTNNHSEAPNTFNSNIEVFPELVPNLRQHLITHNEVGISSDVITYINFNDFDDEIRIYNHRGNWLDGEPIRLEGEDSGFCLRLVFLASSDDKDEEKFVKIEYERLQRFKKLYSFSLFAPHRSYFENVDNEWVDDREFALDLGRDFEKASILISEILQKVYLVPLSQELVIEIEVDDGSGVQENNIEENASSTQAVNDSTTDNIDEQNDSYEAEDDSAGVWMNILCFLIPIVGFVLYFVKRNELPNAAKSYLIWAATGFGLTLLVNLAL